MKIKNNIDHITDSKNVWRAVKSNFLNKIVTTNRVLSRNSGKILSDREKVINTLLISFFVNIGNTLKIDDDKRFIVQTNDVFDPVLFNPLSANLTKLSNTNADELFECV